MLNKNKEVMIKEIALNHFDSRIQICSIQDIKYPFDDLKIFKDMCRLLLKQETLKVKFVVRIEFENHTSIMELSDFVDVFDLPK